MPYRLNEQGDLVWEDDVKPTIPQTYEQRNLARQSLTAIEPAKKDSTLKKIGNVALGVVYPELSSALRQKNARKKRKEESDAAARASTEFQVAQNIVTQGKEENEAAIKKRDEQILKQKVDLAKLIAEQIATGKTGKGLIGQPVNSEWGVQPNTTGQDLGLPSGPQTTTYNQEGAQLTTLGQMQNVQVPQTNAQLANQLPAAVAATQQAFEPEKVEKQPKPTIDEMKYQAETEWDDWVQQNGNDELKAWESLPQERKRYYRHRLKLDVQRDYEKQKQDAYSELGSLESKWRKDKARFKRLRGKYSVEDIADFDPDASVAANSPMPTLKDVLLKPENKYPLVRARELGGYMEEPKPEVAPPQVAPPEQPVSPAAEQQVSPEMEAQLNAALEDARRTLQQLKDSLGVR